MDLEFYNKTLVENVPLHVRGETLFQYVKQNPDQAAQQIYQKYSQSLMSRRKRQRPSSLSFDISETGFKLISNNTSVIAAYDQVPGKSLFCGEPHFVQRIGHKRAKAVPFMIDIQTKSDTSQKIGFTKDYIFLIMTHMDPLSLLEARLVCKKWNQIASSNNLWEKWLNILKKHNHNVKVEKRVPYFKTFVQNSLIGMVFKKSLEGDIIKILIDPKNEDLVKFIFSKIVVTNNISIIYPNKNRKEIKIPTGETSYLNARLLIIAGHKHYYVAPRLNEIRQNLYNNKKKYSFSIHQSLSLYRSFLNNIF